MKALPQADRSPGSTPTVSAVQKSRSHSAEGREGLIWALLSPVFLGTIPILAKLAYSANVDVLTVVALRTTFAALLLWLSTYLFRPKYIVSSVPAIGASMFAGAINGFGSIFFYRSLFLIDASLGQLINITYLVFVTVLLRLAGQTISLLTIFRILLAISAIYLLTLGGLGPPNWLGVGFMLIAAFAYATQLALSQRIMFDIPAPTMTLYSILAMALVVDLAWIVARPDAITLTDSGLRAILLMGAATALSRLTLFLGVKHLGGIQTALLGILEVVVTIVIAILFLGERLTPIQWVGAFLILASVTLIRYERGVPRFLNLFAIYWRIRLRFLEPRNH